MLSLSAVLLLFCASCGSCGSSSESSTPSAQSALSTTTVTLTNADGEAYVVTAEIADTTATRSLGLMYRESLDDDAGMLFVFDEVTENPFWMKNTPISLDIIFIDENRQIISIAADTTPYSTDLIYPSGPYLYTLEVNAGYAAAHALAAGDTITF